MRCGERDAASDALTLLAERATASGTPQALGLLARCRALATHDLSAGELYQGSLEQLSKTSWLTEVAQTHLLYGEWLRRQKHRIEAREQLRRAYEMFDTMGATAFAERTRVELLATGERARSRRVETTHDLTPRELQVARPAAQRETSSEIAGQLFISANTVDNDLRKVFQKLNISSRREIVGLLPDEAGQLAQTFSANCAAIDRQAELLARRLGASTRNLYRPTTTSNRGAASAGGGNQLVPPPTPGLMRLEKREDRKGN